MRQLLLVPILCCSLVLFTGCSATIPKSYDFVQELSLSKLQKAIMQFFQSYPVSESNNAEVVADSACQYQQHQAFYQQGLVEAQTLVIRAQAMPDKQASAKPYEQLLDSLYALREEHQQACFTRLQVELHRQRFVEILGYLGGRGSAPRAQRVLRVPEV